MHEKTCFECRITKPEAEFYPHPSHKDRLSTRCRDCTGADMARRWRAKHPEPAPYVPPTEKRCGRCREIKPLDDFYAYNASRDKRQPWCKACSKASVSARHKGDPAAHAAYNRQWDSRNPDKKADSRLKWRLGIPHGSYAAMLAEQYGCCAICGSTSTNSKTHRFHVDHDAATGEVRGLLCGRCNTGIGQLLHDPRILHSAISYLSAVVLSKRPRVRNR